MSTIGELISLLIIYLW